MTKNKRLMITLFGIYWNNNLSNMGLNLCKIIVDSRNNPVKHEPSIEVILEGMYTQIEDIDFYKV